MMELCVLPTPHRDFDQGLSLPEKLTNDKSRLHYIIASAGEDCAQRLTMGACHD